MYEGFTNWWMKDRFNIMLTISAGFIPVCIELGIKNINVPKLTDYVLHISLFGNYFIQSVFIFVTLFVLIANKHTTYKDLSESKNQIKQYMARNCNIKIFKEDTLDQCYKIVNGTVKQFYTVWLLVWFLWLIYYLGNMIMSIYGIEIPIFSQTFDFLSSSAIFVIYMILSNVTVNLKKRLKNENGLWYGFLAWICILTLWLIGVCVEGTSLSFTFTYINAYHLVSLLLSAFSAVSFVLVLGKINSNYLQIPRIFMFGLYIYAITQSYTPFQKCNDLAVVGNLLNSLMPYITLVGKIFLMLTLCWIVNQKRFIFFVIHKSISIDETPNLLNDLNKDPVNF